MPPARGHCSFAGVAHAEHDHTAHTGHPQPHDHAAHGEPERHDADPGVHAGHHAGSSLWASLGVVVADYEARLFRGDYQGVVAGVRWMRGRLALAANLPAYRIEKNGRTIDGVGDLMVHGHLSILASGPWATGVMMMASAATGDGDQGLGMGHPMLMPEVWGAWTQRRIALSSSLGLGYAVGGSAVHAEHGGGMWPLVEPMNAVELTYGGGAMIGLARELGVGLRVRGAVPIGDGAHRLIGAVRIVWVGGRTETSLEVQHGAIGDPFGLRGVLETAIRLR